MATYGYVRVSSREQNVDRQLFAMKGFDIPAKNIYCDWMSGKDFDRPAYQKMIKRLKPGDLIIVKSIDRLGRNYEEILTQWQRITKDVGADILVLDMELLDTRRKKEDLTGTLVADIVLQLLAYVAQTEREFIRQRQAEGIAAAKARGVHFGKMPMERPPEYVEVRNLWSAGKISAREAARILKTTHRTFLRWVKSDVE